MDHTSDIRSRTSDLLASLPAGVELVVAGKTRTPDELAAALAGGAAIVGHNYVQEAEASIAALGRSAARWHLIGHLQRNKARRAVELFDAIESLDSLRLAQALERSAAEAGRILPVLIEVNSGGEDSKDGVAPEAVVGLASAIAVLPHLRLEGLMTMGPLHEDPELMRPAFRRTRELFETLRRSSPPGAELRTLSMGMSTSFRVAIEEGATRVRIGSALFGPRG